MEKLQLTEEQKKQLKKLQTKFAWKMTFETFKLCSFIFLASTVLSVINYMYIKSQGFLFLGSFVTGFLLFRTFRFASEQEYAKVKEEIRKIIQQ